MNIVKAVLIKKITDDGCVEVEDNIPLGKIYSVDLNTIKEAEGLNINKNKKWKRKIINIVEDGEYCGWFPTELLDINVN